jgi:hydroxymethylpyrimidine/phosphomethylpyrimidine kinase
MTPRILVIAGSDSGGGAGIQADIKTVTMLGGHAMTSITALTAQNTLGVDAVHPIPTEMVIAQMEAVVRDIGVDAVKIGMIGNAVTAAAVADRLEKYHVPFVFDPVMVSTSGATLADADTIASFERLMALATVTTPNLPELEALGGEAKAIAAARALLIKGGHGAGDVLIDRLVDGTGEIASWSDTRIATTSTHGTGCTLSTAIAVGLAEGMALPDAIARARIFVRLALREAPGLGAGHGPMGHQNVRLDLGPDLRLNQFVLPHRDYVATRDFYRTLGLTLIVDAPENSYARFEAPGGATLSIHGDEAGVNFECDELDAHIARALAAGIVFEGPVDQPWLWREAWTRDPSGNRVLLYQAGENRRYPPWRVT